MASGRDKLIDSKNSKPGPDEGLFRAGSFLSRSALGLLPGGGTLAEVLALVVTNPSETRRDAFLAEIALRLDELAAEKHLSIDDITGDNDVSALFLQATQSAMRSAGEQKLKALRNAAINGALKDRVQRTTAFIALGAIDRLSDLHIVALRCFRVDLPSLQPPSRQEAFQTIRRALPHLGTEDRSTIASLLIYDLRGQGLIDEGFRLSGTELSDLSEVDEKNGESTLFLTIVGSTVLDYIDEA